MQKLFKLVICLSIQLFHCQKSESGFIYPTELKCEYIRNPLGIETAYPRLSWKLESNVRNQFQTFYEILVASSEEKLDKNIADVWQSGRVKSDRSMNIKYNGRTLGSGEKYYWKVRVGDKNSNASIWSKTVFWQMGLLHSSDWLGKWIGCDCSPAPLFRKEFDINKSIEQATVYISGLGYYELRINGEKISDNVLDPGQTDYEKRTFYVPHDVTSQLQLGTNVIGVELGNGFYYQTAVNSNAGWQDVVYGKPRFIAQLRIKFRDGTEKIIVSDKTWKATSGPTIFNNVYVGDFYDARLEKEGWDHCGYDDSIWQKPRFMESPGERLVSQKIPPIKRMKTIKPQNIYPSKSGKFVYDMGQNFAGWVRLKIKAQRGTEITLRFSEEVFENGEINPASCGGYATEVIQTDKYICKGNGEYEIWEPRFTYHGFRYVEMSGYPGTPTLENIEGVAVFTSAGQTGQFSCSDSMLNKIHNAALWTITSNMHSIITDCPHREKCGWLGDVLPEVLIYNFDMHKMLSKFERDIETSRLGKKPGTPSSDGLPGDAGGTVDLGIPWDVAPGRRTGGHRPDWGSTFIHLPWFIYLYYGDAELAREHWGGMVDFMDNLGRIAKGHIIHQGYGDMFSPGTIWSQNPPVELTSTALYYFNSQIMAKMADVLNYPGKAQEYKALAHQIKTAFNSHFYDHPQKSYNSQTANSMALELGLVPAGDENIVAKNLVTDIIDNHNGHFSTGHMGSRYLYEALSKNNYGHIARLILTQKTYPGMGYLFEKRGATTFWESWGEEKIDLNSAGVRSRNHPFQAGCDAWFYRCIGGINPDPQIPGFKKIILKPDFSCDLSKVSASYNSTYGLIKSEIKKDREKIIWFVTVPVNTTAHLFFPTTELDKIYESDRPIYDLDEFVFIKAAEDRVVFQIGSGQYRFKIVN